MTQLIHMTNMNTYSCESKIKSIEKEGDLYKIIIDQTCFYPQGGGQPSDTGIIKKQDLIFSVSKVIKDTEKNVIHYGTFNSSSIFNIDDEVFCEIDIPRRLMHSKIHTMGHLIDGLLIDCGYNFKPDRAYHYPEGPYVQYFLEKNMSQEELDIIKEKIEKHGKDIIKKDLPIIIRLAPDDSSYRIVTITGYKDIPCGGTHVNTINEIKSFIIKKIKIEKGFLRISYLTT